MKDTELTDWIHTEPRDNLPSTLRISDVREIADPTETLVEDLAHVMVASRIAPELLDEVIARIGWAAVQESVFGTPRLSIRNGAFGELLAATYLEEVEGFKIPVNKVRFQIGVEQTLPATDILAVRAQAGTIVEMHFVECKLRTVKPSGAALAAHTQLVAGQEAKFAPILIFILGRLHDANHPLRGAFLEYLTDREEREIDTYGVFLVMDTAICKNDPAGDLIDLEPRVRPLHVRNVQIGNLSPLIGKVYERIAAQPVADPDDVA